MSAARSLADCGNECSHTAAFLRNTEATGNDEKFQNYSIVRLSNKSTIFNKKFIFRCELLLTVIQLNYIFYMIIKYMYISTCDISIILDMGRYFKPNFLP